MMAVSDFAIFGGVKTSEPRYRLLEVDLDVFLTLFIPGDPRVWFRCTRGVPEGTRIVRIDYDPFMRTMRLLLEHDSFEPLHNGQVTPRIEAYFNSLTMPPGAEQA